MDFWNPNQCGLAQIQINVDHNVDFWNPSQCGLAQIHINVDQCELLKSKSMWTNADPHQCGFNQPAARSAASRLWRGQRCVAPCRSQGSLVPTDIIFNFPPSFLQFSFFFSSFPPFSFFPCLHTQHSNCKFQPLIYSIISRLTQGLTGQ